MSAFGFWLDFLTLDIFTKVFSLRPSPFGIREFIYDVVYCPLLDTGWLINSVVRQWELSGNEGGVMLTPASSRPPWSCRCHNGAEGPRGLRPCTVLHETGTGALG